MQALWPRHDAARMSDPGPPLEFEGGWHWTETISIKMIKAIKWCYMEVISFGSGQRPAAEGPVRWAAALRVLLYCALIISGSPLSPT